MSSTSRSIITRRAFVSAALFSLCGALAPSIAHGDTLLNEDDTWKEMYRDEDIAFFEQWPRYKAVDLHTGEETICEYDVASNQATITGPDGIVHIAYADDRGSIYIDGEMSLEVVYLNENPPSGANGCVKISEYDTTLSADLEKDSDIIEALSWLPFYGWVFDIVGFVKDVFEKVSNRGEVYFHIVRYYCDTPERRQEVITYAYSDAAHTHLIDSKTEVYPL